MHGPLSTSKRLAQAWLSTTLGLLTSACGHSLETPPSAPDRFPSTAIDPSQATFPFPEQESPGSAPARVARLEVVAPDADSFVIHGTLPVPRGAIVLEPGRSPLAVRGGGQLDLVAAQVEIVTRYPTGEPEVIEVAALVRRDPAVEVGSRLHYDVVAGDYEVASRPVVPDRADHLIDPNGDLPLRLRTRDVFGNVYSVDLRGTPWEPGFGSAETVKRGPALRQRRTYSTLVPVEESGRGEPLPHLMGVHAYLTEWAGEERISLELRVNNGATSGSREPTAEELPAGIVYWDSLELVLPPGWRAESLATDPFLGKAYQEDGHTVVPLVAPYPDDRLHMMAPQAQLERRLTLIPRGAPQRHRQRVALEGLAFCVRGEGLWSWWNPETARYMPQRSLLSHWEAYQRVGERGHRALRSRLGSRLEVVRRSLRLGRAEGGLMAGSVMGWAHPLGAPVQGMTGGSGIQAFEGHRAAAAASARGVEAIMLEHRMNVSRQAEAQWNHLGQPVGVQLWLDAEGRVPFDFRTHGRVVPPDMSLPSQNGPRASRHVREVHLTGRRPPYDQGSPHLPKGSLPSRGDALLSWMPHDGQHLVRYTKNTKALVWLAADSMARDDLLLSAELFHLMFHGEEHVPASWSPGITLAQHERQVLARPHQGLPLGRDQAWGIDAMSAAYSVADPAWRALHRDWFTRVSNLFLDAAMPNGLVQRIRIQKIMGARYDATQAFECLFLLHAERCMIESVLRGTDDELRQRLEAQILQVLDYLYWGPVFDCQPARGGGTLCGPRWHFAVAPDGGVPYSDSEHWGENYLPADGLDGGVETSYAWAALEYGALISESSAGSGLGNLYLRRARATWTHPKTWDDLLTEMFAQASRDSNDNSGNWAGFVGRLQVLGAGSR